MHKVCYRLIAAVLLFCASSSASTITTAPKSTPTSHTASTATCEFRTINYITDSLPQQCLKSSWSNANGTSVKTAEVGNATVTVEGSRSPNGTATVESANITSSAAGQDVPQSTGEAASGEAVSSASPTASEVAEAAATDLETGELNDASFLSFEEWKKQTLEKAGQANANIGGKRSGENKKRDSESIQNHLDSLGEEGEIDLDFGAFRSGGKEEARAEEIGQPAGQEMDEVEGGRKKEQYRSKDAGKTCKERFSYASFDAGATIVKTHPGAKNPKAVLIENKDSYMLSECTVENKFVIIELSEDIWIDTVVLANYEFFSSMIRTFRVSVSDRYPVKIDKWKDVGTYEARNSREIQAFLISNPQIWARYIRIEFLSHYGKEYYCPLSLVRVHGTRMLESWKETEASGEEDELDEVEPGSEDQFAPDAVAEVVQIAEKVKAASDEMARTANIPEPAEAIVNTTQSDSSNSTQRVLEDQVTTPWEQSAAYLFRLPSISELEGTCDPSEAPVQEAVQTVTICTEGDSSTEASQPSSQGAVPVSLNTTAAATAYTASHITESVTAQDSTFKSSSSSSAPLNTTSSTSDTPISPPPTATTTQKTNINSTSPRNKTTSTSSASSSLPTIQESFFKAVSRRLNFLESNSTLSLKYIEEQSKILREAFTKVEKKQLQKTTTFLDALNSTVLDELRQFRQQYDEIWQSTVISLESQRDESRREILAISSRLNILADEVVFQKRMSIVQSVLLLLCLALVIFSRVSAGTNIDFPTLHSRARLLSGFPIESPLESPGESPEYRRASGRVWLDAGQQHRRQMSDDDAPPTPVSAYSRSEEAAFTPPSGGDDINAITGDLLATTEEPLDSAPPSQNCTPAKRVPPNTTHSSPQVTHLDSTASPQARTPKKRKGFIRQRASSNADSTVSPNSNSSPAQTQQQPPPTISIQNSTPTRRQCSLSTSPSPVPEIQKSTQDAEADEDPYLEKESTQPQLQSQQSHLPSPPPDPPDPPEPTSTFISQPASPRESKHERKQSFSIVRKPLPALPPGA